MIRYARISNKNAPKNLYKLCVGDAVFTDADFYEFFEAQGIDRERVVLLSDAEGRQYEFNNFVLTMPNMNEAMSSGNYVPVFSLN